MKISYIIVIFTLIQLSPIYGKSLKPVTTQDDFVKSIKTELFKMTEDFSEKAKNISENLLKDKVLDETASKEVRDVKSFLQAFLQDYPHFKRFKLYEPLIGIFESVINHEYDEVYMNQMKRSFMGIVEEKLIMEDSETKMNDFKFFINDILQDHPHFKLLELDKTSKSIFENITNEKYDFKFEELIKLYFEDILNEYERNFKQLIKNEFLPKFLELQNDLKLQELQLNPESLSYLVNLTKYEDFKNLHKHFNLIIKNLSKPDPIHTQEIVAVLQQINILENIRNINIIQSLIKDDLISNLSSHVRHNLTQNLRKYIENFKSHNDILKFVNMDPISRLQYYLYNVDSYEDLAIMAVLNRRHYNRLLESRFHLECRYYVNKLLIYDLQPEYENYIPVEEQSLIKIPKIIKSRNKYEIKMFNDFFK
ncbi:uncharacterized protein ACRADG_004021 [Cochliomyia hominivorax]